MGIGHEIGDGSDIAVGAGTRIGLRVHADMAGDGELVAAGAELAQGEREGIMGIRRRDLGIDRDVAARRGRRQPRPRDGHERWASRHGPRPWRSRRHARDRPRSDRRMGVDMDVRPGTGGPQAGDPIAGMGRASRRQLGVSEHGDAAQRHVAVQTRQ